MGIDLHNMCDEVQLDIIVAVDEKFGYAVNDQLPWKLKNEYQYFLKMVSGSANIMGKNCWVKCRQCVPIDNSFTAVVSTSLDSEDQEQFSVSKSISEAIDSCVKHGYNQIFIGGGRSIYDACLKDKRTKRVFMTHIRGDFGCDAFFPIETMRNQNFKKINHPEEAENKMFTKMAGQNPNTENGVTYDFCCYTR